jgi:hypothetical protein
MEIDLEDSQTIGAITRLRLAGAVLDMGRMLYRMPFTNVWIPIAEYIQQEQKCDTQQYQN